MSHKLYLPILLIGLCITTGLSAMYNVDHFKSLLAAKNYPAIRAEVEDGWPEDRYGMILEWKDGELALSGTRQANLLWAGLRRIFYGPGSFSKDIACGKALRTLIIKEILHPVIYGQKELGLAIAEIEALAHPFPGKSYGIFGNETYSNRTVNAIKIALCQVRGENPGRYGAPHSYSPDMKKMADEIIVYVGAQAGEANLLWGKLPFTTKLWANRWNLWAVWAVVCVAVLGYAHFMQATKNEEDDADEAEEEVSAENTDEKENNIVESSNV